MLSFEGKEIETDNDGYLKESSQWSEALAEVIAEKEAITLSPEHWEVVGFSRHAASRAARSPTCSSSLWPSGSRK
jgi:TusE/DsrC/DsvC family sulfur relay protein